MNRSYFESSSRTLLRDSEALREPLPLRFTCQNREENPSDPPP